MVIDKQSVEAGTNDWLIPLWVKAAIAFFALSGVAVLAYLLLSEQKTLFGLSAGVVIAISLGLVFLSTLIVIAFWFFPRSLLALYLYGLIRFFRAQICIFALLGMVYLLAIHTSPFSLRGSIVIANLVLLFLIGWFLRPLGSDSLALPWMQKVSMGIEKLIGKINTVPPWILSAVAALLPVLIVCTIIYFGLNAKLQNYGPYSSWKDETTYWLRIRSFSHAGLNAGYNAPNESIAPAAFNHYGEGSPFYIYMYGSIGRLIGWSAPLPLLINFVLLALAILSFIHFTQLDPLQIVFTGLIAVLTWPILLYLPMTTQETLNQALGFVLSIVFFKFLTHYEGISLPARIFFVFLVYLAALIRLSWGLLLIPAVFYALNGTVLRRVILAVLLGLSLYLSATLITNYLVPPVNNSIFAIARASLMHGPQVLMEHIADQFSQMFRSGTLNANIAVMFQIVVILGWSTIQLARLIKSKLSAASILRSQSVFDLYNVTALAVAGIMFYLQSGFQRTFAPSILVVYLLQAARKNYKFLATLLVLNLALLYSYVVVDTGASRILKADFTSEFPEYAQWRSEIEKWVAFDPATENPWCNTLLVPLDYYDRRLITVPPGIGFSAIVDDSAPGYSTIKVPVKSKYLLFDQKTYEALADHLHVRLLSSSSIGDLYYNLDSGCQSHP